MSYKLSQEIAVVGTIDPLLRDDATAETDWIDMSKHQKCMFVIAIGATDIVVDAKLREGLDSTGGTAQDITGKAITQLSATDDNKRAVIEEDASELDLADKYKFVSCQIIVGNGTLGADTTVIALASRYRYDPASDADLASVAEIVA